METKLLNQEWKEIWTVLLNDSVFNLEVDNWLIHRYLIYQLSNARRVVAHSKTRWEVKWSTRKLYRQKGTWRARVWDARSPIRIWWGVAFGPRNNVNFSISMNKKERRLALCHILSSKFKSDNLIVLDDINFSQIKTKNMISVLESLNVNEDSVLLAMSSKNEVVERSWNNLPKLKTILVGYLNPKDLLKYNKLILLKDSLDKLNSISI